MISYLYTIFELNTVPWIEIGFFILTSYTPYILSEALGWSGILSILISGLLMRNYAYYSLSPFGNVTIDFLTEWLGIMSENFIFAYVGISVPLMINDVSLPYVLIGIIALLTSRFLSVVIVSLCVNPFKDEKILFSHQLVMTIGGLRGAVAFYLALNVSSEYKHLIITTTISLILFTVIGMGSATPFILKCLNKAFPEDKIIVNKNEEEVPLIHGEKSDNVENLESFKDIQNEHQSPKAQNQMFSGISCIEEFDKKYLQRFFRKDGWRYWLEGNEDAKEGTGNDGQIDAKEIYKRKTKNCGDLSPHRISNLVNSEIHNKILDSGAKENNGRALTPPTRKQKDPIVREGDQKGKSPRKESTISFNFI